MFGETSSFKNSIVNCLSLNSVMCHRRGYFYSLNLDLSPVLGGLVPWARPGVLSLDAEPHLVLLWPPNPSFRLFCVLIFPSLLITGYDYSFFFSESSKSAPIHTQHTMGQIVIIWPRLTGRKIRNLTNTFLHFLVRAENFWLSIV